MSEERADLIDALRREARRCQGSPVADLTALLREAAQHIEQSEEALFDRILSARPSQPSSATPEGEEARVCGKPVYGPGPYPAYVGGCNLPMAHHLPHRVERALAYQAIGERIDAGKASVPEGDEGAVLVHRSAPSEPVHTEDKGDPVDRGIGSARDTSATEGECALCDGTHFYQQPMVAVPGKSIRTICPYCGPEKARDDDLRCARCCQSLPDDLADRDALADPNIGCGPGCGSTADTARVHHENCDTARVETQHGSDFPLSVERGCGASGKEGAHETSESEQAAMVAKPSGEGHASRPDPSAAQGRSDAPRDNSATEGEARAIELLREIAERECEDADDWGDEGMKRCPDFDTDRYCPSCLARDFLARVDSPIPEASETDD